MPARKIPGAAVRRTPRSVMTNKKMSLEGRRILIVEDDYLQATMLRRRIERAGGTVVGPAWSRAAGLLLVDGEPFDGAVLDAELADGSAEPIATLLATRGVPFVVVAANDREYLPPALREARYMGKPVDHGDLLAMVADSLRERAR
ncbi:response regulator [Enhydrobacter sp.]|uniref:response regulator n=1 Tax=Enhydrobacter sp. TaxID=1894999 RepID=UPI00262C8CEC|nr:response regulator [Enhydrobacter sp.]WIM09128.1 MAG: hypothetical protein OJF58_000079 [Enhydrobacter sp.]